MTSTCMTEPCVRYCTLPGNARSMCIIGSMHIICLVITDKRPILALVLRYSFIIIVNASPIANIPNTNANVHW